MSEKEKFSELFVENVINDLENENKKLKEQLIQLTIYIRNFIELIIKKQYLLKGDIRILINEIEKKYPFVVIPENEE